MFSCKCGKQYPTYLKQPIHCTCGAVVGKVTYVPTPRRQPLVTATRISRLANAVLKKYGRPEDEGLGDVVERLTTTLGIKQATRLLAKIGINCGCGKRKEWLNKTYPSIK